MVGCAPGRQPDHPAAAACPAPGYTRSSPQGGGALDPLVAALMPGQDAIAEYAAKQWEVRTLARYTCRASRWAPKNAGQRLPAARRGGCDRACAVQERLRASAALCAPHLQLPPTPRQGVLTYLLDPARQAPPELPVGLVRGRRAGATRRPKARDGAVAGAFPGAAQGDWHTRAGACLLVCTIARHPRPAPQRTKPLDVADLVARAGLVSGDGGGLTAGGFRFMLMGTDSQLWLLLREYISSAEHESGASASGTHGAPRWAGPCRAPCPVAPCMPRTPMPLATHPSCLSMAPGAQLRNCPRC